MCIEESFNAIFNEGNRGGGRTAPPPMDYRSGKSAMDERVGSTLNMPYCIK